MKGRSFRGCAVSASKPDWSTSTQTEFPISQPSPPCCTLILAFFCFRLGDRGCDKRLNFDAVVPREWRERVFGTDGRLGRPGSESFAVRVGEEGRSFVEVMGLVGGLDKGDGDEMNEFKRSSLRRDVAEALRLREVVATAGSLPLDGCDAGAGVSVASLDFFGLSGFLSGDEELPLRGEERCFPVAV